MSFLIDTDIIIYSIKSDAIVNANLKKYANFPKAISVISYGELVFGARKSRHIEKNMATVSRIAELFPLIEITRGVMDVFGEIKAIQQKTGKITADIDLLIASTALYLNYTLVTNNVKHFAQIADLKIDNWAE
jgi:tRNA(fMet)-specific endonuclease VapC